MVSPGGAGDGKGLLMEKLLSDDLHVRTVRPVHPQDMEDQQLSFPEFGQHRLDLWYNGRGPGNSERFFLQHEIVLHIDDEQGRLSHGCSR
jgi:hypothetical protein